VAWLCEGLDVTRFGFHAWLTHSPSQRSVNDEVVGAKVYARFKASDRTCGARRVWRNVRMTGQLVTDALVMAIWRRGKPDALLHHSDRDSP